MLSDCFYPLVSNKEAPVASNCSTLVCKSALNVTQNSGITGSAYLEMDDSKVICSVVGPSLGSGNSSQACSLSGGSFTCEVRFASFLADNGMNGILRDNQSSVEKRLSEAMKDSLESAILLHLYPKAMITIHATILQSSAFDTVSLINCGSLALLDASIQMKDIVSAYSLRCAVPLSVDTLSNVEFEALFLAGKDAKNVQESEQMNLNISTMSSLSLTTYLDYQGRVSPSVLMQLIQRGKVGCAIVREQLKETIESKLKGQLKE